MRFELSGALAAVCPAGSCRAALPECWTADWRDLLPVRGTAGERGSGAGGGQSRHALLCFALLCFALLCFALLCFALPKICKEQDQDAKMEM